MLLTYTSGLKISGHNAPPTEPNFVPYGEPYMYYDENQIQQDLPTPRVQKISDYLTNGNFQNEPVEDLTESPYFDTEEEEPEMQQIEFETSKDVIKDIETDAIDTGISGQSQLTNPKSEPQTNAEEINKEHTKYTAFFAVYAIVLIAITASFASKSGMEYFMSKKSKFFTSASNTSNTGNKTKSEGSPVPISSLMQSFVSHHVRLNEESLDCFDDDKLTADASLR
jgi:hypothetical protein